MTVESLAANTIEPLPPASELAMIEFFPEPTGKPTAQSASHWLEGQSSAIERVRVAASQAASSGAPVVVIYGEPGSGKLRAAQWIHSHGRRSDRPLMVLDAVQADLDTALLQAHKHLSENTGIVPGTIVVRNISAATASTIQRLLEILTLQGTSVRCGIILLADENVAELRGRSLQHGQLFGRAGEMVLTMPPLRSRPGDTAILARTFLEKAARRYRRKVRGLSPQALNRIENHPFPGNIRELAALIDQAVLRSSSDWVTAECFPGIGEPRARDAVDAAEIVIRMPGSSLREIELAALRLALRLAGGRIVRASELLGITRHALRRKLEKYNLSALRSKSEHRTRGSDLEVVGAETQI